MEGLIVILILVIYAVVTALKQSRAFRDRVQGKGTIHVSDNPVVDMFKNASMSSIKNKMPSARRFKWFVLAIVAVIFLFNAIIVVPAGTTGVVDLFGKVRENELSSGLHLVNPLAKIVKMSIRTEEYTMSVTKGEGQRQGADAIRALTNEGLTVDLDITVFYHLEEWAASDVYRELNIDYAEKIIRPEIRSAIREIIAQYNAKAVYSDKRDEIAQRIVERLRETIGPRGIQVEQVLLRNVTLPADLSKSIQEKLQAEQESQRYDFLLEREAKEADRKRIEAEGQRDAQSIIDQSLSPAYLQYLYIRELKDREGTIYVPTDPGSGIPVYRGL